MFKRICILNFSALMLALASVVAQNPELNDHCETATPIKLGDNLLGSTAAIPFEMDNRLDILQCAGDGSFDVGNPGLWFVYDSTEIRNLKLSTCNEITNFSHRITVFSSEEGECFNQTCGASSMTADVDCSFENSISLELPIMADRRYHFLVHDRFAGESGDFLLSIKDTSAPPENGLCATAEVLVVDESSQGTTVGAEIPTGISCLSEMNPGVFYFIPAFEETTNILVTVSGGASVFELALLEGDSCEDLACSQPNSTTLNGLTNRVLFEALGNVTYYLYVHAEADQKNPMPVTGRFGVQFQRQHKQTEMSSGSLFHLGLVSVTSMIMIALL